LLQLSLPLSAPSLTARFHPLTTQCWLKLGVTCDRAAATAQDAERSKTERRLKKQLAAASKIAGSVAPLEARVAELESLATQGADTKRTLEEALAEATRREKTALAEAKAAATVVASLRAGEGSGELLRASKSGRRAMVALARAEKQLGLSGSAEQASDWTWLTNRLGARMSMA
jgi:hypothetical protein